MIGLSIRPARPGRKRAPAAAAATPPPSLRKPRRVSLRGDRGCFIVYLPRELSRVWPTSVGSWGGPPALPKPLPLLQMLIAPGLGRVTAAEVVEACVFRPAVARRPGEPHADPAAATRQRGRPGVRPARRDERAADHRPVFI